MKGAIVICGNGRALGMRGQLIGRGVRRRSAAYGQGYASDERQPFDEDAAREPAESELASEGYDHSYGCTDDCSGHDAGWQWRAENGYASRGNSESFAEGGYAFDEALESRVDEMRDDYEAGIEPDY